MATEKSTVNIQTLYISIFVVFIAGFIAGVWYSAYYGKPQTMPNTQNVAKQNVNKQEEQAILNLEAEVTANPKNHNAWIQLGHLYFDSDQFDKAISAYNKSLELHPGTANLLTDLGVMYRRAGNPTKALESFDQAITTDNTHEQSRMNKGIVLHFDFNKTDEAIKVWESVVKLNPNARLANGDTLNDFITRLKTDNQQPK